MTMGNMRGGKDLAVGEIVLRFMMRKICVFGIVDVQLSSALSYLVEVR